MILSKKEFLFSIVFMLFCLPFISAQSDIVYDQIDELDPILKEEGYSRTFDLRVESLNEDEFDRYTVDLDAGTSYKIIAVCDGDCGDIDLFLYDSGYNQVDSDEQEDDVPIVEVRPSSSGEYQIKVVMYDCDNEPCYFGIAVYEL